MTLSETSGGIVDWLFDRSIRVRRVVGPYRQGRQRFGMSRLAATRFALRCRQSLIGRKGWLPYSNSLSLDPHTERQYSPAIKQWHWRGHTFWQDRREVRRQAEAAHERYVDMHRRVEAGEFDGVLATEPPTDADLERARQLAREIGLI